MMTVSPRAAALRILAERQRMPAAGFTSYSLAEYQMEAVRKAAEILRRRDGVIIADGVGLGKTYIAAALVEQHRDAGPVVVAIPAALRKNWRRALSPLIELMPSLHFITHGQLSRGMVLDDAAFVVVDEAHAFRNPRTRRYRALRLVCRKAKVILLTATPVNNSIADLYYQLRLFARDDSFRDLGIGSLALLLRPDEIDPHALARLRDAVLIRRSREELRSRFPILSLPDQPPLRFPSSLNVCNIPYHAAVSTVDLKRLFDDVTFAIYSHEAPRLLLSLSLLKRIQSSRAAALVSFERLIGFYNRFLEGLAEGHWLTPRNALRMDAEQLCFSALVADTTPSSVDPEVVGTVAAADLAALMHFRNRIEKRPDLKMRRLVQLLAARGTSARTLVFTEFTDTARALWREVAPRWPTGLITGGSAFLGNAPVPRWEVIKRFAPMANGVAPPRPSEAVHVLIATDVLSEGLNLQDADVVVSYDLPWNPVRLIQRAGRVDRIGSPYAVVTIHNFIPDREFDELIGLVRRLREKLAAIRSAVGQQGPVLDADPTDTRFLQHLASSSPVVLNEPMPAAGHCAEDLADAGPLGSVATLSESPRRVLVILKNHVARRELLVEGPVVTEAVAAAEPLITAALSDLRQRPVRTPVVADAVARAFEHVHCESLSAAHSYETAILCRAVQAAIARLGVAATPRAIAAADELIGASAGFVGDVRRLLIDLRTAQTAEQVEKVIVLASSACRPVRQEVSRWSLVAALACD